MSRTAQTSMSIDAQAAGAARGRLREWWPVLLVWLALAVVPFARSVELPIFIMAVLGVRLLIRHGRELAWRGAGRLFTLMFLLIWAPMLASVIDSVHVGKAVVDVLGYLRFYFAGLFVLTAMSEGLARQRLLSLSAYLLLFWLLDAVVQLLFHYDLFGFHYAPGRLNALFGEHSMRFGYVLAALSPLLFEYARRHWPRWTLVILVGLVLLEVLLGGGRSAWIMLAVILSAYLLFYKREHGLFPWKAAGATLAGGVAVVMAAYLWYAPFTARMDTSLLIFKGDVVDIDTAISWRVQLWRAALQIYRDHPINGVGVNDFRFVYPQYARPDDPFVHVEGDEGLIGALHAHNFWLGVADETGTIGLIGSVGFAAVLISLWRRTALARQRNALPWGMALLALLFPLNTHVGTYSLLMSALLWLMVALYCAACENSEGREDGLAVRAAPGQV